MMPLEIEIAGPLARTRTIVDGAAAVDRLMASMVGTVGDAPLSTGQWHLYRDGGERLEPSSSLADQLVDHGDVVFVARSSHAIDESIAELDNRRRDGLTPTERAAAVIPARVDGVRRALVTSSAFFGFRSTPGAMKSNCWERAGEMWRWTDHLERLRWIVGRPTLRRTVVIGVVAHAGAGGSARTAVELAATFSTTRTDRITLVDGSPERSGVTRLMTGRRDPGSTVDAVAEGSYSVDARFGNRPITTVGVDLALARIPTVEQYRGVVERLRAQSGIVVVDCGSAEDGQLSDLCEQLVLVSDRPISPTVATSLSERPTVVVGADNLDAVDAGALDRSIPSADAAITSIGPQRVLELASVLVDRWPSLGVASVDA